MSDHSPLWSPSQEQIANAKVTRLREEINAQYKLNLLGYTDLHKWSIENTESFWKKIWDDNIINGELGTTVFAPDLEFRKCQFFPGSRLNVAENILYRGEDDAIAVTEILEDGSRREFTWRELRDEVQACASALVAEGIRPGDRVAAWAPNIFEVLVVGIATLSIGGIVSTSSPDFAPNAVLDRFGQIQPTILFASASYLYNGKKFDCLEKLDEISRDLGSLRKTIVFGSQDTPFVNYEEWIKSHRGEKISFEKFPFDTPGFILFSSGTTGKPKCITHSAAGILLKLIVEHRYHFELSERDKVFFYTTCGWMMWNWMLYVLASGSSIVLYDGSPLYPDLKRLFALAESEKVTYFGLSAKFLDSARKLNLKIDEEFDLASVRLIVSSGSVLAPESYDYVYEHIKRDAHLVSMSGGTDICGCFLIGVPTEPVYRGELQAPCLGMATNVFLESGEEAPPNVKGELVCTKAFPSMPLNFWGDSNDTKYKQAYFEKFEGVWTHGDFSSKNQRGSFVLFGRSDATLNSKGVRIGTAEIYRVVETFAEISESMAVSQNWEDDTRVILFITLKNGHVLDEQLKQRIKLALRTEASPRHVPDLILQAPELPRTKTNKLVELAVTDVINGREVRNRDALANPQALDWFANRQELQI